MENINQSTNLVEVYVSADNVGQLTGECWSVSWSTTQPQGSDRDNWVKVQVTFEQFDKLRRNGNKSFQGSKNLLHG